MEACSLSHLAPALTCLQPSGTRRLGGWALRPGTRWLGGWAHPFLPGTVPGLTAGEARVLSASLAPLS